MDKDNHSLKENQFNTELNKSVSEVIDKYVELLMEYYAFIGENKNIVHTKNYTYLLARGLDTITHVFTMILFYTKNLELTYYHSQKSFYLYVEFIEQIIDVQNTFLHLSSRDASIFVYKKTIYEINQECRKEIENNSQSNDEFEKISAYIQIYKQIPHQNLTEVHEIIMQNDLTVEQLDKLCMQIVINIDLDNNDIRQHITTFLNCK